MASKQCYGKADPEKLKMVKMIRGFFPMGSKGRLRKNEVYLYVLITKSLKHSTKKKKGRKQDLIVKNPFILQTKKMCRYSFEEV